MAVLSEKLSVYEFLRTQNRQSFFLICLRSGLHASIKSTRHRVTTDDKKFDVYHRRNNTKSLNGRHACFIEESLVQLEKITVNIRLQERLGAIKAFADVLLHFGADGWLRIDGFSIVQHPAKPASVVPPGNKGKRIMFDVILLKGKIERLINTAVLDQYNAALAN